MQYKIYEGNLERLEQKLKRVENKCKKYDASFKYAVIGEEFNDVEFSDGEGGTQTRTLRYVIIDVEGFAKVNGWEFVATIDHRGERNVIRQIVDCEIPERYWTSEPYCEHCKTLRRRNDTFLVHNVETGEFQQVGRSCVRDFTGGYDAELAASYIAMHEYLIQGEEASESSPFFGGSFIHYHDLRQVMIMSKAVISKLGFVSSSSEEAPPSKQVMFELEDILNHGVTKSTQWLVDAGVTLAYETFNDDKYLEAVKKYYLDSEDTSSFMQNMKTIFSSDYCKYKDWGYIVAAIFTYDREQEKARRAEEARQKMVTESEVSQYVGEPKQRITFKVKECKCVSCYDNGYYGLSYLYKFIDADGNVFMWSTSNGLEEDKVDTVTGTVKEHKEYKGRKQTWVTRCKVTLNVKEQKPESPEVDPVEEAFQALDILEEAC